MGKKASDGRNKPGRLSIQGNQRQIVGGRNQNFNGGEIKILNGTEGLNWRS